VFNVVREWSRKFMKQYMCKMRTKAGLVPNPNHETRKTKTKTQQMQTQI
jgi:hypothetical protein